jgi:hypothetical protein
MTSTEAVPVFKNTMTRVGARDIARRVSERIWRPLPLRMQRETESVHNLWNSAGVIHKDQTMSKGILGGLAGLGEAVNTEGILGDNALAAPKGILGDLKALARKPNEPTTPMNDWGMPNFDIKTK